MIRRLMLAGTALWLCAAAPVAVQATATNPAVPTGKVAMTHQPGSKLEATARQVAGADVADGGSRALLLLGSQRLGSAGSGPALFVSVQSDRACGSAGCSTSVYLPTGSGWQKVLDGIGTLVVDPGQHRGMHDLMVGDDRVRWTWNGRSYVDTLPAAAGGPASAPAAYQNAVPGPPLNGPIRLAVSQPP